MIKNRNVNYFTTAEVAAYLGFSNDYIRKLILNGKITAQKLGRNWIINEKDINKIHRQRRKYNGNHE